MPIDEIGGLPKPTITNYAKKVATPTIAAPETGPAQPPPPQPSGTGPWGGFGQGGVISTAPWGGFGQGGIPGASLPGAPGVSPLSTEAQRLLNAGSVQQVFAQRALQQWNNRIALSDAQEVFKNINAGYAQALYAAELWAQNNMPTQPVLSGGGSGYGGFGGGSDPRGYALSMGLYNWRIS